MDNEFAPSPDEIRAAIDETQNTVRVHAISSMNNNPDDAARALELGQVTGMEPAVIHDDLEEVDNRVKAHTISQILDNNPQIADYIRSHPLAASVSNDDYANLDAISKTVPNHDFVDALVGLPVGMVKQGKKILETLKFDPQRSGIEQLGELGDKLIGAIPDAILGGAQGVYEGGTAPPEAGHVDVHGKKVEADWERLDREARDLPAPIAAISRYMYGAQDLGRRLVHGIMGGMFGAPVAYFKSLAGSLGMSET